MSGFGFLDLVQREIGAKAAERELAVAALKLAVQRNAWRSSDGKALFDRIWSDIPGITSRFRELPDIRMPDEYIGSMTWVVDDRDIILYYTPLGRMIHIGRNISDESHAELVLHLPDLTSIFQTLDPYLTRS